MSEQRSGPDFDPDLEKGEGHVPAMNFGGPKKAADEQPPPGTVKWEAPQAEEPESLEGGVRRDKAQSGEPAKLPNE